MATIGLAHRSPRHFVAEWTDSEPERDHEDAMREVVERKRVEAIEADTPDRAPDPEAGVTDDEGWFSGEPI